MKARGFVAAAALALSGCSETAPARDQWKIVVHTDAQVPQFGEFVDVEILSGGDTPCSGCSRELSANDPSLWPVSFGIEPSEKGEDLRVRVRLARAALASVTAPTSDRVIDALVRLPEPHGVTEVDVVLAMDCFGRAADVGADRSCDPKTQSLGPAPTGSTAGADDYRPGTWKSGRDAPCRGDGGELPCIDGGAFLLGSPTYRPDGDASPTPEQLVVVPPFFLDVAEVSVGDYRALVASGKATAPDATGDLCTYAGGDDQMPMNCVTRSEAAAACQARGMRLPTEAEWEWAAGNLTIESRYPWLGASTDLCLQADVGVARFDDTKGSTTCDTTTTMPGPRSGTNAHDATALGILDLGGNVAEWVADNFVPYTDAPCWGSEATLHDAGPCTEPGPPVVRGGSWRSVPAEAAVAFRGTRPSADGRYAEVGFRCVKPAGE